IPRRLGPNAAPDEIPTRMNAFSRLDLQPESDGILIVRFRDRRIADERSIRETGDQLLAVTGEAPQPTRIILDFSGVDLVSSRFLGKLILVQRRVDALVGRLRLGEVSGAVASVLQSSNMDRLFAIDRDRLAALEAIRSASCPPPRASFCRR